MNQKELNEIRRRFRSDKNAITRVYGCYVNGNKEVISYLDSSLGLQSQEETEMYLNILKKALSGALGRNLLDIVFSTKQVADSEEHRLLQTLRLTSLQDAGAREAFYRKIIDSLELGGQNYLILLAADTYDVPFHSKDGQKQEDASDQVFQYILCSICPVKEGTYALRYSAEEKAFHGGSSGQTVAAPVLGFLFPAFDSRAANIYNALYYSRNPAEIHQEVIDSVFCTQTLKSPEDQKEAFQSSLYDTLQTECSFEVVQSVHEQVRARLDEHKESKDPEVLEFSLAEMGTILANSGVPAERVTAFQEECKRQLECEVLNPKNILDNKKFEVCTPEIKVSVAPEFSYLLETRVIDGKTYLLIPADEGIAVNGIDVCLQKDRDGNS